MSSKEDELKKLMLASQMGDPQANRLLLQQLGTHLRAFYKDRLGRFDRSAGEAEDLVQDALIAIHIKRHTYLPDHPFMPWVYAIARYKLIDYLRKTRASSADASIDQAEELVARDERADAESARDIQRLMAQLPAKTRLVIQSVKLDGAGVRETALRFGMSESAVKVAVHRGIVFLSRLISRDKAS